MLTLEAGHARAADPAEGGQLVLFDAKHTGSNEPEGRISLHAQNYVRDSNISASYVVRHMNVRAANIRAMHGGMSSPPRPSKARTKSQVDADTAGGRLRDLRGDRTQDEVAAALGVSRANLSKYETGGLEPPDPVVKRAALYFGVTPAYIRYGDVQNRLVRISGYVGAGARIEAVQQTQGGRLVEVPSSWDDALALEIRGLSAYPVYDEGDVIVIRGEQRFDEAEAVGRLCVVETADGEGLLKRVRRGSAPGLYTLESLNAPPIEDVVLRSARPVKLDIRR